MNVRLINHTPDSIETIYVAARTCYSPDGPNALWDDAVHAEGEEIATEKMHSLIDKVVASGHLSVLEHIAFTFAIEGISRACSHQLVRHRIASFSQQSQRYVSADEPDFVIPDTIAANPDAMRTYLQFLKGMKSAYKRLIALGVPKEDARFVLPNATMTNIVMTMNFRELFQVCQIRLCTRAQWEIRELFWKIKAEIRKIPALSGLAEYLQPRCAILGYCPEDKSCGMSPEKNEFSKHEPHK